MSLADALRDWQPGAVEMTRRVDPWPAAAFSGLIGAPEPPLDDGDPLPPMWHWFTLLEHPATAEIGVDGHPGDGHFLPPIPGRRRMFAGGRLHARAPIPVGSLLRGRSEVASVAVKEGRSGEMAFVTIRTELTADGELRAVEEQDIVYRSEPGGPPSYGGRLRAASTGAGSGGSRGAESPGRWQRQLATDPVLLFRFSALTYNGHRIHYDLPYATGEEGYPGLVVHGPLLALLALDLPRVHGRAVRRFEYRLVRPAFVPATLVAVAQPDDNSKNELALIVSAQGTEPSLTAKVTLENA